MSCTPIFVGQLRTAVEESDALILPSDSLPNDDEWRVSTSPEADPISICLRTTRLTSYTNIRRTSISTCTVLTQSPIPRTIQLPQHQYVHSWLYSPTGAGTSFHLNIYTIHTSGKGRTLDDAGKATTPLLTHIDDIHGRPAAHGPRRSRRRSRPWPRAHTHPSKGGRGDERVRSQKHKRYKSHRDLHGAKLIHGFRARGKDPWHFVCVVEALFGCTMRAVFLSPTISSACTSSTNLVNDGFPRSCCAVSTRGDR